jgi:hypothetical protein
LPETAAIITILVSGTAGADGGFTPSEEAAKWVGRGNVAFQRLLSLTKKRILK